MLRVVRICLNKPLLGRKTTSHLNHYTSALVNNSFYCNRQHMSFKQCINFARAGKHSSHFLSTCTYGMSSSRSTDLDHEATRSDGEPVLCMDSVTI